VFADQLVDQVQFGVVARDGYVLRRVGPAQRDPVADGHVEMGEVVVFEEVILEAARRFDGDMGLLRGRGGGGRACRRLRPGESCWPRRKTAVGVTVQVHLDVGLQHDALDAGDRFPLGFVGGGRTGRRCRRLHRQLHFQALAVDLRGGAVLVVREINGVVCPDQVPLVFVIKGTFVDEDGKVVGALGRAAVIDHLDLVDQLRGDDFAAVGVREVHQRPVEGEEGYFAADGVDFGAAVLFLLPEHGDAHLLQA
jgi:hypothetical protein